MKRILALVAKWGSDLHLLDQMVVSGTTFILQLVLAAVMGLEMFGVFSGWQIMGLILLGLQQSFFVSIHQVQYRDGKSTGHHYSMRVFYLNVMTVVPIAVFISAIGYCCKIDLLNPVYIMSMAAWLLFDTLRRISITEGKMKAVLVADLAYFVVMASSLSAAHLLLGLNPMRVVLCICLANLIASLLIWQQLAKVVFNWVSLKLVWRMHWKNAKWLVATNILQMAGSNFFLLCCGWWIGATALGSLRLVQSIFGVFSLFFQYFENKNMPLLAAASDDQLGWSKHMRLMYQQMHRVGVWMILGALIVLIPIGIYLGPDLVLLVTGFLVLQIFIIVGIPVRMGIRSQRENKSIFAAYTYSSIFSILSAKLLITSFGAQGAVIGLCSAQLIMILYWMNILKTKFNFPWKLYM